MKYYLIALLLTTTSAVKINPADDERTGEQIKAGGISKELSQLAQDVDEDQDAHDSNISHASSDEMTAFTSLNQKSAD